MDAVSTQIGPLPDRFQAWFERRGWRPRSHQLQVLRALADGRSVLLTAPTGGGKTLAGFLPSLVALAEAPADRPARLHTLYISPLKALTVDVHRNLEAPIADMGLTLRLETRTGDTPQNRRRRQRLRPPDILLTTPEQLALMLSYRDADRFFSPLSTIIVDELHALVGSKRGDLLALNLARMGTLAPQASRIGLSATVVDAGALCRFLGTGAPVHCIDAGPGPIPDVTVQASEARVPWSGSTA